MDSSTIIWIACEVIWAFMLLLDCGRQSEDKGAILIRDIMIVVSVAVVLSLRVGGF